MALIKDGSTGSIARVDEDNRLRTFSITEAEGLHQGSVGKSFNLNTGLVNYSGDGTLIYLKNNSDDTFVISAIAVGIFEGLTFSNFPYMTMVKNPTGGDLITDATAIDMDQNRNFGRTDGFDGNVYKGKTGGTLTGGDGDVALLQLGKGGRSYFGIDFHIPSQASIGVNLTLNASGGSADIYAAFIGYYMGH